MIFLAHQINKITSKIQKSLLIGAKFLVLRYKNILTKKKGMKNQYLYICLKTLLWVDKNYFFFKVLL